MLLNAPLLRLSLLVVYVVSSVILTLFASVTQYRPLIWRNTHPYVLVDRHEDVTDPNKMEADPECARNVTFYGYVRGTHLKPGMRVHLIGVGDYSMAEISCLPDPCPIPEKERERTVGEWHGASQERE